MKARLERDGNKARGFDGHAFQRTLRLLSERPAADKRPLIVPRVVGRKEINHG